MCCSFLDLDVPTKYFLDCSGDSYLHIGPVPEVKLCGDLHHQVPKVYISVRNHVWIKFRGSGRILGRGFTLYYVRGKSCMRLQISAVSWISAIKNKIFIIKIKQNSKGSGCIYDNC